MTKLDKETIHQLTQLCRIECSEEEQASLSEDLQKIFESFEKLQLINTDGVPPCNQVLENMVNAMREDEVAEVLDRETFLANAPSQIGNMVRVPPVMKQS